MLWFSYRIVCLCMNVSAWEITAFFLLIRLNCIRETTLKHKNKIESWTSYLANWSFAWKRAESERLNNNKGPALSYPQPITALSQRSTQALTPIGWHGYSTPVSVASVTDGLASHLPMFDFTPKWPSSHLWLGRLGQEGVSFSSGAKQAILLTATKLVQVSTWTHWWWFKIQLPLPNFISSEEKPQNNLQGFH